MLIQRIVKNLITILRGTTAATPDGMEEVEVPANTWAVFPCTGKTSGTTQIEIVNEMGVLNLKSTSC